MLKLETFRIREFIVLACICLLAFAVRTLFMFSPAFLSDEAIYMYGAYAISRGVRPYGQITLVHPPLMFTTYSWFIKSFGADFAVVRILSITIFLITIFTVYYLARLVVSELKGYPSTKIGLACAILYGFYPAIIPFSITTPLFNMLTMFALGCTIFYIKFLQRRKKAFMFLSGICEGLALMTWYVAIFFIVSIFLFEIIRALFQHEKISAWAKQTVFMTIGAAVPVIIILSLIFFNLHYFPQFYMQTFFLQTSRSGLTSFEKWSSIVAYVSYFFPLLIVGAVGVLVLIMHSIKNIASALMLPVWLFVTNFIFLSAIPKTLFVHYLLHLSPYLVFISIIGVFNVFALIPRKFKIVERRHAITLLSALVALAMLFALVVNSVIYFSPYFSVIPNPYTKVEMYVGSYVANLTSTQDKIWTSEPAIAFFANRLIVAPNSTYWPIQGFFNDVFNTSYIDTNGVAHEGLGIVTPDLFLQAWEEEKVKVLIFIRGAGPVPYPDALLWFGYIDQAGVKSWVEFHYELRQIVVADGVAYTYEIWVRG